ncbi:MAG: hypothetical protein WC989_01935 [Micavibrio sp.]
MTFARLSKPLKGLSDLAPRLPCAGVAAALALSMPLLFPAPLSAFAQQSSGYTPPPMFEEMTPPMVRPEAPDGYIVRPKTSSDPERSHQPPPRYAPQPQEQQRPVIQPSVQAPAPPAAPVIPARPRMMEPIIEAPPRAAPTPVRPVIQPKTAAPAAKTGGAESRTVAPKAAVKPAPPSPSAAVPAAPERAKTAPSVKVPTKSAPVPKADTPLPPSVDGAIIKPAPRDPAQSAITGPKTMPSLPVHGVDEIVIHNEAAGESDEPTIFERLNTPPAPSAAPSPRAPEDIAAPAAAMPAAQPAPAQEASRTLQPLPPVPKQNIAPTPFDAGEQGALKKTIAFQPGQIGLVEADRDAIVAGVLEGLDEKQDWRVQIKAFATPHGTGIASDRRIALARALSLRTAMIEQGILPSRIDVLAEGLQSGNTAPADRIDLYLYGPQIP